MNEKVCRACWTWYSSDQAICPQCRAPLTTAGGADSTAPAGPLAQPAAAPIPAASADRIGWIGEKLTIGAGVVIVVGLAVLLLGARYFSPISATDRSFSVKAPAGWTASSLKLPSGEKPLLALNGPIQDGLQAHFVVAAYPGGYLPMTEVEAAGPRIVETQGSGQNGAPGPFASATVDGAPAVTSDSSLEQGRIEYLVVDHANRTYIVVFTGAASRFAELRSGGFDPIIASWHWN